MTEKVVVTGGSGRAGEFIIADLASHGYEVYNADLFKPRVGSKAEAAKWWKTDVTDLSDVMNVMRGASAVIHMAAIPAPDSDPEHRVFSINTISTWNILESAESHNIRKVVIASSINALGAGWGSKKVSPEYFPIDEEHPTRVEDAYSQSKWVGEQIADAFARRSNKIQIASMRFHGLWDKNTALEHKNLGDKLTTSGRNAMGFWSWSGRHDSARACRLAIEKTFVGHQVFFINSKDTTLEIPTMDAIAVEYPNVPILEKINEFNSPLSIKKAENILGWVPVESWRHSTVKEPEYTEIKPSPYKVQWNSD